MNLKLKLAGLGVMSAAALVCAAWALGDISSGGTEDVRAALDTTLPPDAEFVLRDWEGSVGVFGPDGKNRPVAVTAIAVNELREADRALLERGIPVSDRQELLALLEDLGS